MKKLMIIFFVGVMLLSFTSAEIIFNSQTQDTYNLGDKVSVSNTVRATSDLDGKFHTFLICDGKIKELSNIPVSLETGEEKTFEFDFKLAKENAGITGGTCKIKAVIWDLGGQTIDNDVFTNEFKVSNLINLQSKIEKIEFNPGESILIKGDAVKENGQDANGFISLKIVTENETGNIEQLSTINNGFFSINITFPKNMKAGSYLVQLTAYEVDSTEQETNKGFMNYNIKINQIPTSLEIFVENSNVEPGTSLKVKTVLHDQTGELMDSKSIISIKKANNEILEQTEKPTNEYLEHKIASNEPPGNWTVVAVSSKLNAKTQIFILEKEEIKTEIMNNTLLITNTGNVPYNKEVSIKIGNETVKFNTSLEIGNSQEYRLKAPDGEYVVEVVSNGEKKLSEKVSLTGRAVDVKEGKNGSVKSIASHPVVWIFIIAILGFVAFLIMKKGYKRSFFGKISFKKKPKNINHAWENRKIPENDKKLFDLGNPAILSLSIKGQKQPATIISLKIKNKKELNSKKGNAIQTIQEIIDVSESKKAHSYETGDFLFFIFAPSKTKTYHNEKTALDLTIKIKEKLKHHNKLFTQKIDFGIAVNLGELIIKQQKEKLEFMDSGNIVTSSKKLSGISKGEILLDEKTRDKLKNNVKATKFEEDKKVFYRINEIKEHKDHKKFLDNFVKNLEKK